jgi:hypothetical protein
VVLVTCMWVKNWSQQCHFPFGVNALFVTAACGTDSVNYVNTNTFCVLNAIGLTPLTTCTLNTLQFTKCAASRKVAGSIPDGVTGIFNWHNHSGRTVALRSTQPLNRNEYQEYFLGGKVGRCVGLTALPPSCADCLEIWKPQPAGTLRACPGLQWDCFTFRNTRFLPFMNLCIAAIMPNSRKTEIRAINI